MELHGQKKYPYKLICTMILAIILHEMYTIVLLENSSMQNLMIIVNEEFTDKNLAVL